MRTEIRDTIRRCVGRRRWKISRWEAEYILRVLGMQQNVELSATLSSTEAARWWADRIRGITVISILSQDDTHPGIIRCDEPGSMHPLQHSVVSFASESGLHRPADREYIRRHTDRLLLVRGQMMRDDQNLHQRRRAGSIMNKFDEFPLPIRERLRHHTYNLCAACVDLEAWQYVGASDPTEEDYHRAIDDLTAQIEEAESHARTERDTEAE